MSELRGLTLFASISACVIGAMMLLRSVTLLVVGDLTKIEVRGNPGLALHEIPALGKEIENLIPVALHVVTRIILR
jgi:hypothetical protein